MKYVKGLKCRECGREYPVEPIYVCEFCFGPLEAVYDYPKIKRALSRKVIEKRPKTLWRYKELLPIDGEPQAGLNSGFTPLVKAENLAKFLGVKELYIKDDTVAHPTLSFKDRVVAVALTRQRSSVLILLPVLQQVILPMLYLRMVQNQVFIDLFLFLLPLNRAKFLHPLFMSQI